MPSQIPPELIEAYKRADYHVLRELDPFVFHVGVLSGELAALLEASGVSCAAYLTAWHPHSRPRALEENAKAQAELEAELLGQGCRLVKGIGKDPQGSREGEPSLLALGLALEAAKSLGVKFGQNAVVWTDRSGVPELILLR